VPRACVFGEALVDELPDGPVPGGAPLNVACHAAGFGLSPLLVTRVGRDEAGDTLVAALAAAGVPPGGVQVDPSRPTGRAVVSFRGAAPRFEIPDGSAFDAIDGAAAARAVREARPSVVAFGTLAQRGPPSREALRGVLSATKATRLVDLNLRAPWYDAFVVVQTLSEATVVKLSDEELEEVRSLLSLAARDPEALAAEVVDRFRLRALFVTRGAKGAFVASRAGGEVRFAQAPASDPGGPVIDTVGAGDAFTSVVLLGLVRGWSAEESLVHGVAFAGAVTRIPGATPADRSFYAPFLEEWGQREP
jgi:fructokinase